MGRGRSWYVVAAPGHGAIDAGDGPHWWQTARVSTDSTPALKARLRADLSAAIKSRDELRSATIRMVLTAVSTAEVAGNTARELSDQEVLAVLAKEAKKRREAAEAFSGAGRAELASRELDELGVLEGYLPQPLTDAELDDLVGRALADLGELPAGPAAMGPAMKAAQAAVAGRAEGGRVAAAVRRRLGLG